MSKQQSATDRLVDSFLLCTLPKNEWTHHAHLRGCLKSLIASFAVGKSPCLVAHKREGTSRSMRLLVPLKKGD
ncbi:hypothetical protein Cha6605_2654 [Chamaesiphon minutus PCC 6605]|uniref:Uncharacterized protein n=1 Tax=Chamaesiphon minutus (strain ATCC 27169 / PCC 6605) TaxID=1173020 RepID=K9UGA5_CHAP6|nr:hypothetical protein Cha6605_2654 [Chamaesiphon minutus PCC 6605]